ncbi:MAG TPA: M23 family metallopeptidase [Thermoanaerobaculia bacterium]|nr:M23 family metallopeptidase [Thermoanaerobaculia bacterium]
MRAVTTFLIGVILGGVSVFLYLQQTGIARVQREPRIALQTTSRAEVADDLGGPPEAPVGTPKPATAPAQVQLQVAMNPEETMAIPVVGIRRQQLVDTYTQARSGGRSHDAIDILAPRGTPVIAAIDGRIVKLFMSAAGGITVYEMDPAESWIYYYAHLDRYASDLAEGRNISKGEVIGYVGTTGNAPPGTPHLHFAIARLPATKEWWKGQAVNPYPLLMQRGVTFDVATP